VISFAHIALGDGGSVACVRCSEVAPADYTPAQEVLARITEVAEGWGESPGPNVVLCGPEPFGDPDLPQIVTGAAAVGVQRIGLRTDGGALASVDNARGVVHAGVRHIEVLLLGDEELHDSLAETPGLFALANQGIAEFLGATRAAGVTGVVTGRIVVCRHNLESLPNAIAALSKAGVVSVVLELTESAQKAVGLRSWVAAALETGMVNGVWVSVDTSDEEHLRAVGLHALAPAERWSR